MLADPSLESLDWALSKFNLFITLGIDHDELSHSRVIAWLLRPSGSHGIGDLFLRPFLKAAATQAQVLGIGAVSPKDVDNWHFVNVEVARERQNIDLLVVGQGDQFVCPIENKVDSGEHDGQLRKYWKTVESHYSKWHKLAVFLTRDGISPKEKEDRKHWTPLDYGVIADIIDGLPDDRLSAIDQDVSSFLRQYATAIRRRVMKPPTYLDLLSLEIYKNHRAAINRINLALDNKEKIVASVAKSIFAEPLERVSNGKLLHDFSTDGARSFDSSSLKELFPLPHKMVAFQVKYEKNVSLYVWVRNGPDDVRKRLLKVANSNSPPFSKKAGLNKGWTPVYRRQVISRNDEALLNYDSAKAKVEQAIQDFCETDYFPLVNAIRVEFDLPPVPQP